MQALMRPPRVGQKSRSPPVGFGQSREIEFDSRSVSDAGVCHIFAKNLSNSTNGNLSSRDAGFGMKAPGSAILGIAMFLANPTLAQTIAPITDDDFSKESENPVTRQITLPLHYEADFFDGAYKLTKSTFERRLPVSALLLKVFNETSALEGNPGGQPDRSVAALRKASSAG